MNRLEIEQNGTTPGENGEVKVSRASQGKGDVSHAAGNSNSPAVPRADHDGEAQRPIRSPAKRKRIAIFAIGSTLLVAALLLGFLPRWRQRHVAATDMSQLAVPTVSVISPTPGQRGKGLVLPAEIRPWREASIFARANGYLQDWVADIGAHVARVRARKRPS